MNVETTSSLSTTLIKGLTVMEALARKAEPCGVTQLARDVGMMKSNVHRTLQTLIATGYVRQVPTGDYQCTLKLFELASAIMAGIDVRQAAEPLMQRLAEQTSESIHLSTLDGLEVIYLHKIESLHPVRAYSRIGGRAPAFNVASGKALLAFAGDDVLSTLPAALPRSTSLSVATRDDLMAELAAIRACGFAVNDGEWRERVCGLAAPIFDGSGAVVAAIGISGPADRMQPDIERYADGVIATARAISAAIGFNAYSSLNRDSRPTALDPT